MKLMVSWPYKILTRYLQYLSITVAAISAYFVKTGAVELGASERVAFTIAIGVAGVLAATAWFAVGRICDFLFTPAAESDKQTHADVRASIEQFRQFAATNDALAATVHFEVFVARSGINAIIDVSDETETASQVIQFPQACDTAEIKPGRQSHLALAR